jgi:hypothetical protein
MTIRVRGAMVLEDYELTPRDRNDLMIVTTTQFGAEPPVQRLHFMQDNVEPGWQGDFFDDIVLAINGLKTETKRRLSLRIQVYDMDRYDAGLVTAVSGAAQSVAVAFPQLAPYAAVAAFAAPALQKLVENIDDHDRILDQRLTLEISEPQTGHNLLQPGYFVCFRLPVDGGRALQLDNKLQVMDENGQDFTECSYAVLDIEAKFLADRQREIDQKIAKLISELGGKGQSGRAAIEFLRETMDLYDRHRRLERARALQERQKQAKEIKAKLADPDLTAEERKKLEAQLKALVLSDAESALLDEYAADEKLAPFLPAG